MKALIPGSDGTFQVIPPCPPSKSCYTIFCSATAGSVWGPVPSTSLHPQHLIQQQPPVKEGGRGTPTAPMTQCQRARALPPHTSSHYPSEAEPLPKETQARRGSGSCPTAKWGVPSQAPAHNIIQPP